MGQILHIHSQGWKSSDPVQRFPRTLMKRTVEDVFGEVYSNLPLHKGREGWKKELCLLLIYSQAPPTGWQILLRINLLLGWGRMLNHSSPPQGILAGTRLGGLTPWVLGLSPTALLYPE